MAGYQDIQNALRAGQRAAAIARNPALEAAKRTRQLYTQGAKQLLGGGTTSALSQFNSRNPIRHALRGTPTGRFLTDIERYARGGPTGGLFASILGDLGPVGKALGYLLGRETRHSRDVNHASIQSAVHFLNSLGYNVQAPSGPQWPQPQQPPPLPPGRTGAQPPPLPRRGAQPPPIPRRTGQQPPAAQPPQGPGQQTSQGLPTGRFVSDSYIPMQLIGGSSNVYAIGYNPDTATMRVQYLASAVFSDALKGRGHKGRGRVKGRLGRTVSGNRSGPGPVYDYKNVPEGVFRKIAAAGSKGKAIWDNLRIRGTAFGHQYDYTLAAASIVNVIQRATGKRVATVTYVPRRGIARNHFVGRTMLQGVGRSAQQFRSLLPNQRP